MIDTLILIFAAFFSSTLTAVVGVGGGVLLISVMPVFLPPAAVVPVHGVVQLASNASRTLFARQLINWPVVRPFVIGLLVGCVVGAQVVVRIPNAFLPIPLAIFILVMTWWPDWKNRFRLPGKFLALGFVQAFLTLFVGATGPLNLPILLRHGLSAGQIVVTHALLMTLVHLAKVITFGLLGFAFACYLPLMGGMIVAVTAGSWVGTKLRHKLPEQALKTAIKWLVTLLALRMLIKALL